MKNWKTTVAGVVSILLVVLRVLGVEVHGPEVMGHVIGSLDLAGVSAGLGNVFARDNNK